MREKLASRLGFILLSAGCAIGLGNVWRFPYITGECGGGCFLLVYFGCLALLGVPVMTMEFAIGRGAGRSLARTHETLTPEKRLWRVHGVAGLVGCVLIMTFYTTITGWLISYFVRTIANAGIAHADLLARPGEQTFAMLIATAIATGVSIIGLKNGIERVTKWMMLSLFALIVILAAHSLSLDGAGEGLKFLLVPNFERMRAVGVANVVAHAMNQSFLSLSLGIGAMSIFGSYIGRERSLTGEAITVVSLDTLVAIVAGLVILPACFAFGIAQDQGPALIFNTLPKVFAHMAHGRIWGAVFFVFLSCAALSTVIAVFEAIIASIIDYTGWSRRRAALVTGALTSVLALPASLGVAGAIDFEVMLLETFFLPLGSLAFVLYATHRCGWGWKNFLAEANAGKGLKFSTAFRFYCAYILPLVILGVFALAVRELFR